jgi:hypothetical protein
MDNEYLVSTRQLVYARYAGSSCIIDPEELKGLQAMFKSGEAEIVLSGIQAAPFAVQPNEHINALLKVGSCYYFAFLERET